MNTRTRGPEEAQGDLVDLFVEEMKSRRERLAHWVQLLQEELGDNAEHAGVSRYRCRGTVARLRIETES